MLSRLPILLTSATEVPNAARQVSPPFLSNKHGLRAGANFCPLATRPTFKRQSSICSYRQGDELQVPVQPPSNTPKPALSVPAQGTQQRTARAQLKVIGLGLRGISAVNRLIGSETLPEAEFWALDSDKRVLATADAATRVLEVGPGDDACLGQEELMALSGGATIPAAPETPDGHAGAVFVLGSAFGSPGGAPMLLQLVRHLRRQGYFVAATLTRPFEFEGARRLEAADALISVMEEVAHLVVVIAQGVLIRASAELTMGQAQAIADNTLVYTVQSTLWALRAPEVLKVSHGAFLWHGRDLRNIRRPLFPPMMNLLSCPGHATLGRGQAALPLPLLQQAGLASALSTLAEDAVKAASESPFLDQKLESATGVLCVLRVPPSALGMLPGMDSQSRSNPMIPLVADNHKEYALRSAVQVAAMTVRDLVGPHCHDIIVCPQLCTDLETDQGGSSSSGNNPTASMHSGAPSLEGATAAVLNKPDLAEGSSAPGASGGGGSDNGFNAIPTNVQLVRVEVSLLVLERIEEAAEPKAIAAHKPTHDAASSPYLGAAAVDALSAPTAATTARDRMTSVIRSRANATPRRLPPPGAPTPATSFFSGQLPQATAPAAATTSTASVNPASVHSTTRSVGYMDSGASSTAQRGISGAGQREINGTSPSSGPPTSATGFFGGQRPQSTAPAAATPSTVSVGAKSPGIQSARPGSSTAQGTSGLGRSGAVTPPSSSAAAGVAASASTAQAKGPADQPIAATTAAAESSRAHKQARLAAMSALAGGTSLGVAGSVAAGAPGPHAQNSHGAGGGRGDAASAAAGNGTSAWGGGVSARDFGYTQQRQPPQQQQHAPQHHQQRQQQQQQQQLHSSRQPSMPLSPGRDAGGSSTPMFGLKQIPRMAENLATSLVAQSLDLPPQAARWRHQQRTPPQRARGAFQLPQVETDPLEFDEAWMDGLAAGQNEGLGRGLQQLLMGMWLPGLASNDAGQAASTSTGPSAVRTRVAGMLDLERQELWETTTAIEREAKR